MYPYFRNFMLRISLFWKAEVSEWSLYEAWTPWNITVGQKQTWHENEAWVYKKVVNISVSFVLNIQKNNSCCWMLYCLVIAFLMFLMTTIESRPLSAVFFKSCFSTWKRGRVEQKINSRNVYCIIYKQVAAVHMHN